MPIYVHKATSEAAGGCQSCDSSGDVLVIRIKGHELSNTCTEFRLCAAKCGPEAVAAMNGARRSSIRSRPRRTVEASPELSHALSALLRPEEE